MSEEVSESIKEPKPPARGVGNKIEKRKSAKRVKAAFRKAYRADRSLTLKTWARNVPAEEVEAADIKAWFEGKKNASLCNQRVRVNVKKTKGKK